MDITFNVDHVFNGRSSSLEDAYVLRAFLDAWVKVNEAYLRTHPVKSLYSSGVRYGRTKIWYPVPAMYAMKYGDCKSLSAARIAELHLMGYEAEPQFRWRRRPDGCKDFHILIKVPGGYEDPSRKLGMGANEVAQFR